MKLRLREVFISRKKRKLFDYALKAQGILRIPACARIFMRQPMRSILDFVILRQTQPIKEIAFFA